MREKKITRILLAVLSISLAMFVLGCSMRQASLSVNDTSLLKVKERGKLIVGISIPYEPMEFIDKEGNLAGIDVDIAKKIASDLGVGIQFEIVPWDDFFKKATGGEVDIIIGSISITPERSEQMLFSRPYFNAGQVMIVKKEYTEIKNSTDLIGKKIGVQRGTTGEEFIQSYLNNSDITFYDEDTPGKEFVTAVVPDLLSGKIDVIIVDYTAGKGILKKNPSLTMFESMLTEEYYGIATKNGNIAIMERVNNIIKGMISSGEIEAIKNKWFN